MSPLWFVAVPVCRRFSLSPFRFVAVLTHPPQSESFAENASISTGRQEPYRRRPECRQRTDVVKNRCPRFMTLDRRCTKCQSITIIDCLLSIYVPVIKFVKVRQKDCNIDLSVRLLWTYVTHKLATFLIRSIIDYCNSLLFNP